MRLVTFEADGRKRAGAFIDGDRRIVDLAAAHQQRFGVYAPELADMLALIEGGDNALDKAAEAVRDATSEAVVARSDVILKAPIHPPPQMRDCSSFELHLRQCYSAARAMRARAKGVDVVEDTGPTDAEQRILDLFARQPIYYKANRFSVIGSEETVIWPFYSRTMDFELEYGCYLKKAAKDVPVEKARDYIFGYTIYNDFSARDAQATEMIGQLGPAKGKDFDTGNAMGPCIVTADEMPDPYALTMIARVNGEEWGRGHSSAMHWKFEDLIAFISRSETLYPGEFLGSGTVGNGCGLEAQRFLKSGDEVELEVEGIGVLRNRILKPV
ncbi:fumarylacetoacetate hydrolase family protein [Brevundimonas sp. P7753]|jgi:2-keto-4-pentenoate hydratase/2-oxohepta-3-ene-1,7-dioic acid hydratase in catechol pathway|uniref:fumarylacetoacetate hydrolase family protein n=1 Tax=Brevundimonas sp. P7753 TaxID=2726982 RepID=UPI0015BE5F7D|nr:fumarylacetoacetate hydrolase family protein [Brevundimonas sp. P7753]NWE54306.1 fumarylacetoacetate hydrolase family protein [Brevundimonas sp. P7753]